MRMKVVFPPLNGAFQSSAHVCIIYSLARAFDTSTVFLNIYKPIIRNKAQGPDCSSKSLFLITVSKGRLTGI